MFPFTLRFFLENLLDSRNRFRRNTNDWLFAKLEIITEFRKNLGKIVKKTKLSNAAVHFSLSFFLKYQTNQKLYKDSCLLKNLFQPQVLKMYSLSMVTEQKMKFSVEDFFGKCDQIRSFLRIWSHLLKKSFMENFIFCAVALLIVKINIDSDYFTKKRRKNQSDSLSCCLTKFQ